MASYTPNYNLKKPADADSYDIADANGNMDIIDGALNTLNNQVGLLDSGSNTTNDILATAVSVTKSSSYNGSGSSYTGTVPSSNFKYGAFHVDVRGSRKFVTAYGTGGEIATNVYDGTSWIGWKQATLT